MKILKNILWALAPLIFSIILFIELMYFFGFLRKRFYYPWGNVGQVFIDTGWKDLAIFNGAQLVFIVCLFIVSIYVFRRCFRKMNFSGNQKWWSLAFISISWASYCFFAFAESIFHCCPGMFPEVSNSLAWLTFPEFIVFYVLGQAYHIHIFRCLAPLNSELTK